MSGPGPVAELILDVVGTIPAGALASYGDVADVVRALGRPCGARQVAATLSRYGGDVPWWRVVQSAGTVADDVLPAARRPLAADGVVLNGRRVPLAALRWQPDVVALRRVLALRE